MNNKDNISQLEETGDCFKANADYIIDNYINIKDSKVISLCHGKVIGAKGSKIEGITFDHAWIEAGDLLIDHSGGKIIQVYKKRLYDTGKILKDTVIKYNPKETLKLINKFEHYGPW